MTGRARKAALTSTTSIIPPSPSDPLKADFRKFLYTVWRHLNLPDPTPIQYDIARWLQSGPKRLIIEAFRGVGKSWATVAYVLWLLYCDPQHRVMVIRRAFAHCRNSAPASRPLPR